MYKPGRRLLSTTLQRRTAIFEQTCILDKPLDLQFLGPVPAEFRPHVQEWLQANVFDPEGALAKVRLHRKVAFPMKSHRGSDENVILLKVDVETVQSLDVCTAVHSHLVKVRHGGGTWFAQLRFLLSYYTCSNTAQCALVRYLREIGDEHKDDCRRMLGMPWPKWSTITSRRNVTMPVIGWIPVESIQGPAYLQPDPKKMGHFYNNKYVC